MRDPERRREWAREYLRTHHEYAEKGRERSRKAQAAKRAADPGYRHRVSLYAHIAELQGGEFCLICGAAPNGRRLCIDHDHATDEIRGLLCGPCNRMLGAARDSVDTLTKAADYLARPRFTGRKYAELKAVPTSLRYQKKGVAA